MLVGSDALGWLDVEDYELARLVGVIALALILFEGGLTAGVAEIPVLSSVVSLALVGMLVTAGSSSGYSAGTTACWTWLGCWLSSCGLAGRGGRDRVAGGRRGGYAAAGASELADAPPTRPGRLQKPALDGPGRSEIARRF